MDDSYYYLKRMREQREQGVYIKSSLFERVCIFLLSVLGWGSWIILLLIFVVPMIFLIWIIATLFF